jgi:putative NIF3 family GTP cyclohydrolase 1 type 2
MIAPEALWPAVVAAMKAAHPYEEVAYDVYPLKNAAAEYGIGRIGALPEAMPADGFLARVKDALAFPEVRMAGPRDREVRTVAICGGAGASLMPDALAGGADALVTADVRHHEFVDAEARGFLLLDAGHGATEIPGARELAARLADRLPSLKFDFV